MDSWQYINFLLFITISYNLSKLTSLVSKGIELKEHVNYTNYNSKQSVSIIKGFNTNTELS